MFCAIEERISTAHIFIYNKITAWAALNSHLIFFLLFFPDSGLPRRMQFPWDHGESEDLKERRDATDGKRMTASPELIQLLDVVRCDDLLTVNNHHSLTLVFVSNQMVNVHFSSHSLNLSLRSGSFCLVRSVNSTDNESVFRGRSWRGCWSDASLSQSASVAGVAAYMTNLSSTQAVFVFVIICHLNHQLVCYIMAHVAWLMVWMTATVCWLVSPPFCYRCAQNSVISKWQRHPQWHISGHCCCVPATCELDTNPHAQLL